VSPARPGRLLRSGFGLTAYASVLAALLPSAPKGLPKVKNEKVKGHGVLHAVQA